ncbi:MAG TPA: hypothetical protein ENH41_02485 [Candidatus Omnitrophica bacterium]|nr:hypothetical protein [Candidatus Omnitrophota bacterium]
MKNLGLSDFKNEEKMKNTLLIVGDLTLDGFKPAPSLNRFLEYRDAIKHRGMGFEFITYDDVFAGRFPNILTRKLKILLFFPYNYWNNNIERYTKDDRIYGNDAFGTEYADFFKQVSYIITKNYKNKQIEYANSPNSCVLDRDKRKTNTKLAKAGILVPKIYKLRSLEKFHHLLKYHDLYIKPPYGSMGKGISFVTKNKCYTNFIFDGKKIISRPFDYNWEFVELPRKEQDAFIKILIKNKFIFEEAICTPIVRRRKFDLRVYVIYSEIPYFYARSTPYKRFITNWSQGGRIEDQKFLGGVFSGEKMNEVFNIARRCAKILKINYMGIDILPSHDFKKTYVLEAHSFPGYEHGFDLMGFLASKV